MIKLPKTRSSELTEHIGYWLKIVSNSVSHRFALKLEASGVTVAEYVILRDMYGGDVTTSASAVATATGLTPGAVSRLIARLVAKGLVQRTAAAKDRRFHDIQLTPKASALVPRLGALADRNEEEFFSGLTRGERDALRDILRKLTELNEITVVPADDLSGEPNLSL